MTENSTERRPIPGYEGRYEIDLAGNVFATFDTPKGGRKAGRKLTPHHDKAGYVRIALSDGRKEKRPGIHRLLMLTFRPVPNSDDLDVNHIDGNKSNNDLSNLEWLTHRDNILHARNVLGINRDQRGDKAGFRKLTSNDVREIRRLHAAGTKGKDLAARYGVTYTAIFLIIRRINWASID